MPRTDETDTMESLPSLDVGSAETLPAVAPESRTLTVGDCVGRYTIRTHLGTGGMGEVFAAHDPELDRLVAVKLLRGATSTTARLRFQREAQAMARLNHPNVVVVHDVGTVGDRTFVAMELVEGTTLAQWLSETTRTSAQIIDVFLQAGRGLAAAHAAGITHRDFKPSNVMFGDRARVVDFGLARADSEPSAESAPGVLDTTITNTGGVLGTPAYMAPEQRGAHASPLSDQYSFAVSLREALTGVRPHQLDRIERPVPARLRPVLDRALQARPEARFPSMNALLAALERATSRGRVRWMIAGLAGIAVVAAIPVWGQRATDPCTDADQRMVGVWDEPRREAIQAAFLGTKLPYAARTWERVATSLDAYRSQWVDGHTATCRAARIEGRESEALLDRRMACLERGRSLLRELTQVWIERMAPDALAAAGDAPASLPSVAACARDRELLEQLPPPSDLGTVARITGVRGELDRVRAMQLAGRLNDANQHVASALVIADATQWAPIRAETRLVRGQVSKALRSPVSESELMQANKLATSAHYDRLAAESLLELVEHLAVDKASAERALFVAELTDAAITRAGDDETLRARLVRFRGDALYAAGKFPEAEAAFQDARRRAISLFGEMSTEALTALMKLASVANEAGRNVESRRLAEQSLAGMSSLMGAQHPSIATILNELGIASYNQSDYEAAASYFARMRTITVATSGPDSLPTALALSNGGANEIFRGHLDLAQEMLERAVQIRERVLGPDDVKIAEALEPLSSLAQLHGKLERAVELLRRMLAIYTKAYGPDHPRVANALEGLGTSSSAMGNAEEALSYHRRALELRQRTFGDNHPATANSMIQVALILRETKRCGEAEPLLTTAITALDQIGADASRGLEQRGECELVRGRAAQAVISARRALTACEKTSATNPECATMSWLLARALDAAGHRSEALAAAEHSIEHAPDVAESASRMNVATIRSWIAARKR